MQQELSELPERIKKAALLVKTRDGRYKFAWRYRDAVIVVIHIKRSGLLVHSVEVLDQGTPEKAYKGWTVKVNTDIDAAHNQAINFMTACYDREGDKYLFVIKSG